MWLPQASLATPRFEAVQGFELGPEQPRCRVLIPDAQGNLYGTTPWGGAQGGGSLFKMTPDGTIATLYPFDYEVGSNPDAGITAGNDGNFYGILHQGGPGNYGGIYKVTPAGEFTMLHQFTGGEDGNRPVSRLLLASDGNFYGTTMEGGANGLGTFFRITSDGVFTTLTHWAEDSVGWAPEGDIIEGADGNFYGTHRNDIASPYRQSGTVYRVTPAGQASLVGSFAGLPSMNFCNPSSLIQASDGNFYGVTTGGGSFFQGTIFKMTPDGSITLLVEFNGSIFEPNGPLFEGPDGDLYGTSYYGGDLGEGTVFKVSKTGAVTIVSHLGGNSGGPERPLSGLILSPDGSFLGATSSGGSHDLGTVFRMTPTGETTVLGSFNGYPSHSPNNKLLQTSDGSWYGTTAQGGTMGNAIFKMAPDKTLSTVTEYYEPFAGSSYYQPALVEGADGRIYGANAFGGEPGYGSIFRITPEGSLEDFFSFEEADGRTPNGLIVGPDGNFYGTTRDGGSDYSGTLFKLTPGGDFSQLAEFKWLDHGQPNPAILLATDGNFYATSENGGPSDIGAISKVTPEGAVSTLTPFDDPDYSYGRPSAGLVEASDGNFYGLLPSSGPDGAGAIYRVTPEGEKTTLLTFNIDNGAEPAGELVEGPDGALYGVTTYGGTDWESGTVFRITTAGEFSTVFNFDRVHGQQPLAGLTRGHDHHLYGTTSWGGLTADGRPAGGGQIFRIRFGAEVETAAATSIDGVSAALNASVQPSGHETEVTFQYGTSPTLDSFSTIPAGTIPAGDEAVAIGATLAGLSPSTTYYFRAVATNAENPVQQAGEILSFTTNGVTAVPDIAVNAGNFSLSDGGFILAGLTRVGQSVDLTLTLRNSSPGSSLNGIAASLSGVNAGSYAIVTPPAATLAGEASTTCVVRFTPGSAGLKLAKLSISSSDPDESPFHIHLGGIALPGSSY